MNKMEKLISKLEEVWPGELGDDIDVKEIEKNLKAINVLMPLLQTMQITPMQDSGYLIQILNGLPVDEKGYEVIRDFILQNTGYERPAAEVVKTVDNSQK